MGKDITGHEFEECLHKNKIVKFPEIKESVNRERTENDENEPGH